MISNEPLLSNLTEIITIESLLSGDWTLSDSLQRATLRGIANIQTDFSSGIAIGILNELGESLAEPEPNFPIQQRSLVTNDPTSMKQLPLLGIYPNPAKETAWIHYPVEADMNGKIQIFDPEGRLLESMKPNSNGLLELSLENYKSGIYIVELHAFDRIVESIKLVVVK